MPGALRRALRRPARTLLKFEPVSASVSRSPARGSADRGSSVRRHVWASDTKTRSAADHKHAFTITRESDADVSTSAGEGRPFFMVHVSQLDGSYRLGPGGDSRPSMLPSTGARSTLARPAVRLPITRPGMR